MSTELKQVNKLKKTSRRNDNQNDTKFIERLIKISRVSKVTKGGKKLSFRAIVVVGDENGKVGVGVAKADDVVNAFKKAKTDGRKNLIKLPITKSFSIPHNVIGNFGACKVIMRPSIEGSGVIAGGAVRAGGRYRCNAQRYGDLDPTPPRLRQPQPAASHGRSEQDRYAVGRNAERQRHSRYH